MSAGLSPAVLAARQAQEQVERCLATATSFRLEAGAGAGKTYSLVAALKKIIAERGVQLMHAGQQVACITYTEVARLEIANEVEAHPAILVNTIHGFGWSFISRFQKALRQLVASQESRQEAIAAAGGVHQQVVEYNLGFFDIDADRITLGHDDIPRFLAAMLGVDKFRRIFRDLYPILFIDEYQDTDPLVMAALTEHFFATTTGPVVGLFGDHWQTIYRKDYELLTFPNVEGIDKGANFRSVPAVVNVLNRLRPELSQAVDDPLASGEARFYHCNAYEGTRVNTSHAKEELPPAVLTKAIEDMTQRLADSGWDFAPGRTKILMLTHNAIAAKQGYPNLAKIFERNEAFAKKEDAAIAFLADVVEPMCAAYTARRYGDMFRLLGNSPTIRRMADKERWRTDIEALIQLRHHGTIGQVIDHLRITPRPRLPDRLVRREEDLARREAESVEEESRALTRYRALRAVPYQELIAVAAFINGFTPFATQHSVKGAEFENVLVVLSGGWNQYNWPRFLEYRAAAAAPLKDQAGYLRARNLFYVAVSRPKRRLAVLATQALSAQALGNARHLFGEDGVVALPMSS